LSVTIKIPNAEKAIIEQQKIVLYLLDADHPDGGSKARLLLSIGYSVAQWQQLDVDLRSMHLNEDFVAASHTVWGMRYEIVAPIIGPAGDTVLFRSIWQIDLGTGVPRLITMYPE
jgi:hypothetical protein